MLPAALQPIRLPAPPPGEAPPVVRGLYINAWIFGSQRFYNIVRLADTTEVNALVIDVKDDTGYLTYRSSVPTAIEIGANGLVRAPDVRERLAFLRNRGIHPIARIVVAKDALLAKAKPEWAVHDTAGGLWEDRMGDHWVDAYRDSVWLYAADIAEEAVLMGFAEVQFDYVRFPDEPAELLDRAIFPARREGQSRRDGVRTNLRMIRDRIAPMGVPFTVDIFGLTTSAKSDMGIGQYWEDIAGIADVVLPMVYPSHYSRGAYGYARPNHEPYNIVRRALEDGLKRSANIAHAARIRPFLQSFSIRRVRYTAVEIRAQMEAVYDLGLTDWVLWNASGRYPPDAFLPNDASAAVDPASRSQLRWRPVPDQ
ncbi:MAG: GTP-binding protein [Gemmatimonadetes bacterium]|nr:GTP-binding protein [Gemmatimonadota bacterium]